MEPIHEQHTQSITNTATTAFFSNYSAPPPPNFLNLPPELKSHTLNFLPLNDLLGTVRVLNQSWKIFTEQLINEQKRRLLLLDTPKNVSQQSWQRTQIDTFRPPSIEESLCDTFSHFKISLHFNSQTKTSKNWQMLLSLLNKTRKDIELKLFNLHKELTADIIANFHSCFKQLNHQPNISILSIYHPPTNLKELAPTLELPNLKALDLTITDFAEITTFNHLINLKTLYLSINNSEDLNLETMAALPPNLQELTIHLKHPSQRSLNNLSILNKYTQLRLLALVLIETPDINLSFQNLPLTELYLEETIAHNLQSLSLPSTLTHLGVPCLQNRHIDNLWEILAMCPKIIVVGLNSILNLYSLTQSKLAALPYLRVIELNFSLDIEETDELVTKLQQQLPHLRVTVLAPQKQWTYLKMIISEELEIILEPYSTKTDLNLDNP